MKLLLNTHTFMWWDPVHKDPFDRLLAVQANVEAAEFVTADPIFAGYPVRVLW